MFEQIMHVGASKDANLEWELVKFEQVWPNLAQTCRAISTVQIAVCSAGTCVYETPCTEMQICCTSMKICIVI
jgi:hypothetical protein